MGERNRRRSITGPLILIAIGLFFLLSNLDLIDLNIWDVILRFWPILIIAAGLDILIGQRSAWGAALALVVVLAILAGGIYLFDTQPQWTNMADDVEIPLGKAEKALVTLEPALGYLQMDALPEGSTILLAGELRPFGREEISETVDFSGTLTTIHLKTEGISGVPFISGGSGQPLWDLALHPGVTTDVNVDLGVGKVELDLRDTQIDSVDVEYGLGQAILLLPAADDLEVHIEGGIGEIRVVIPDDVGVRLRAEIGLGNVQVPSSFLRDGDYYLSPGYAAAVNQIEMTLNLAIGSIQVR